VPWLLIGCFVASAGLFSTEGDVLMSLMFIFVGMWIFLLGAIHAVATAKATPLAMTSTAAIAVSNSIVLRIPLLPSV